MIEANSYRQILNHLNIFFQKNFRNKSTVRVIGLLFAPPHSELAAKAIVPKLNYYHVRSDTHLNVYCVGYGAGLPIDEFPDVVETGHIQGVAWQYSDTVFDNVRQQIQELTTWEYSGEVDFLLVSAVWEADKKRATIDFSESLVLVPDKMVLDKATRSFPNLFETICTQLQKSNSKISTSRISDMEGLKLLGRELVDSLVNLLPSLLKTIWTKGLHFRTIDLRRQA